jgi:hypothetical protein
MGLVDDDPLRQAGRDPVCFDFPGQMCRIAGLAARVEVGCVDDHGGIAVAQEAHDVGRIGEVIRLPPGNENSVQFSQPPVIAFRIEDDQGVAELYQLLQDQPGQV